ncbi:MAG: sigma-54-dependent Fis family transcriptional regulator [Desulfobacula sp.]|nr:sigma-54-dependent Fis family transcriptional regulator [Desulfobacula sp.]
MSDSVAKDFAFFRGAMLAASSSLNLADALRAFFDFASQYFPLEGLTLHKFEPRMKSLHLLFLVTKSDYIFLDELISMSKEGERDLALFENNMFIINTPSTIDRPVGGRHSRALKKYLPFKDRAYLVANLSTKNQTIGHLCLMGSKTNCFTKAHEDKLRLLMPLMSMAMMNLLQYHRTIELQKKIDAQRQQLSGEVTLLKNSSVIIGQEGLSKTMKMVRQLTGMDIPVLILGETGTGKELIADAVQRISLRKNAPYIKVNCGAIPETLVDSELFGYRKGAFTGANEDRAGRFEQADGGTLFLDEIGDLPLQLQVRLLRVLQNGVIERLGSGNPIPVDVRIIAATHRPLETMLQNGTFREDLYYRLSAFPLTIPPLRERTQDLPSLVYHFLKKIAKEMNFSKTPQLSKNTMERLKTYSWPGNVRELQNLIERAMILAPDAPLKLDQYLPIDPIEFLDTNKSIDALKNMVEKQIDTALDKRMNDGEVKNRKIEQKMDRLVLPLKSLDAAMSDHIKRALDQCHGKIHGPGGAADLLKIHPSTLRKRMDKLNIPYGYKHQY